MSVKLSLPVCEFKSLKHPQDDTRKLYVASVKVTDIPDILLDEWRDGVNPRLTDTKKPVYKDILETLRNHPQDFFLLNRGLTVLAEKVDFDNKTGRMTWTFSDKEIHGLADGAHSATAIRQVKEEKRSKGEYLDAYVKVDTIEGFGGWDKTSDLTEARNTSTQVKAFAIANLKHEFDWLKEVLKDEPYFNRIAWKQNDKDDDGEIRDIHVETLLSFIVCMDKEIFDDDNHPTLAYNGRVGTLKLYRENYERYAVQFGSLVKDFFRLRDMTLDLMPVSVPLKKDITDLDSIEVVKNPGSEDLPFIGKATSYSISGAYVYPILSAMRQLLVKGKDGRYMWKDGRNPEEFLDETIKFYVKEYFKYMTKDDKNNANKMGKSSDIYEIIYKEVRDKSK